MSEPANTMRHPLRRHAVSNAQGVSSAAVSVRRAATNRLVLKFRLVADATSVQWPEPAASASRRDELWQRTCCEAFISAANDPGYCEWNFAPSGDWQCYTFDGPRSGRTTPSIGLPALDVYDSKSRKDGGIVLTEWRLRCEFDVAPGELLLGISMVVADRAGGLDFWALAHSGAKPDFHARDTWTLRV